MTKKDISIDEIVESYKKKLNKIKEEGNYSKTSIYIYTTF